MVSKLGKYIAYGFLFLVLFLFALILLIPTNWGMQVAGYIGKQTEIIDYKEIDGSLYGQLSIIDLNVDVPAATVDVSNVSLNLGMTCLFDLKVCIESLKIGDLQVQLHEVESSDSPSEPTSEYIKLPVEIEISDLSLTSLKLLSPDTKPLLALQKFYLELNAEGSQVYIPVLSLGTVITYAHQEAEKGTNKPKQEERSTKKLDFSLAKLAKQLEAAPQITIPEVFVPVDVLLDSLRVNEVIQMDTQTEVNSTLISKLSMSLSLVKQRVETEITVFVDSMLSGVDVNTVVDVNLSEKFQHNLNASLVHNGVPLSLDAKGNIDDTSLSITSADKKILKANMVQDLSEPTIPVNMNLTINSIDAIYTFLNVDPIVDFEDSYLDIEGNWQAGYQFTIGANVLHPMLLTAANNTSKSSLDGKLVVAPAEYFLNVEQLATAGEVGEFTFVGKSVLSKTSDSGTSTAGPNGQVTWQANNKYDIAIRNVMLSIFGEDLPKNISGNLALDNKLTDSDLSLTLLCEELTAQVMERDFLFNCDLNMSESGRLSIEKIAAQAGDNNLLVAGSVTMPSSKLWAFDTSWLDDLKSNLTFNIDAPDLEQIMPELSGIVNLEGNITGNPISPEVDVKGNMSDLAYQTTEISDVQIKALISSADNWQSDILVSASDITLDKQTVDNLELSVQGDLNSHTMNISLIHPELNMSQDLKGGLNSLDEPIWKGQWTKGNISHEVVNLALEKPIDIRVDVNSETLSVSEHCWLDPAQQGRAQLCIDEVNYANGVGQFAANLSYNLSVVANYFLPELIMDTSDLPLTTSVKGSYSETEGLNAQVSNLLRGRLDTPQHQLNLTAIIANLDIADSQVKANIFAGTEKTGTLGVKSELSLLPQDRKHSGQLGINKFDLSVLQRFLPIIDSLKGDVNANIGFNGDLTEPSLNGELTIDEAELILDAYAYPLTKFNQTLRFDGGNADIVGGFFLGKGEAKYNARINFLDGFSASGSILGEELQFAYQTQKANVSPDIQFDITPEDIVVVGKVFMDETLVRIESLPESAVSPSSDTIIIGQEPPPPAIPIGIDIDLSLLVDPAEKGFVKVEAMGLFAALHGDLNVKVMQRRRSNDEGYLPMQTLVNGQIKLLEGSYEAYGQNLQIRRGSIFFSGEPSLPQFDISAIRNPLYTEDDVVAGLNVTGNPILPRVELFSEPSMTQARQLSYLLQGQDILSSSGGEETSMNTNMINALVNFGVGGSENRVGQLGRKLGFDSLNFQTAGQGDNTQLQLTGRISDDLQITYGVGVFDSASEVILKYKLLPKLFVQAKSGVNNAVNLFYQFSHGKVE